MKKYEAPEIQVQNFSVEDVITTSVILPDSSIKLPENMTDIH